MVEPWTPEDLTVRPPRQRRSREAWARVLDAGVALLEDGGYEAFTIAAVCERAGVAPPAIYARTTSKEALFLAVYEHGISRLHDVRAAFDRPDRWIGLTPHERVRTAVTTAVRGLLAHRSFFRAVVLISAAHPEVQRRGSLYSRELGSRFVDTVSPVVDAHPDAKAAAWSCFSTVFAAVVIRVAYGSDFGTASPVDDDTFTAALADTAVRYLLSEPLA
ncbi:MULTISPECIES: TetR/AcrR family transcriptional regulator [unclassified Modestobacter]